MKNHLSFSDEIEIEVLEGQTLVLEIIAEPKKEGNSTSSDSNNNNNNNNNDTSNDQQGESTDSSGSSDFSTKIGQDYSFIGNSRTYRTFLGTGLESAYSSKLFESGTYYKKGDVVKVVEQILSIAPGVKNSKQYEIVKVKGITKTGKALTKDEFVYVIAVSRGTKKIQKV